MFTLESSELTAKIIGSCNVGPKGPVEIYRVKINRVPRLGFLKICMKKSLRPSNSIRKKYPLLILIKTLRTRNISGKYVVY